METLNFKNIATGLSIGLFSFHLYVVNSFQLAPKTEQSNLQLVYRNIASSETCQSHLNLESLEELTKELMGKCNSFVRYEKQEDGSYKILASFNYGIGITTKTAKAKASTEDIEKLGTLEEDSDVRVFASKEDEDDILVLDQDTLKAARNKSKETYKNLKKDHAQVSDEKEQDSDSKRKKVEPDAVVYKSSEDFDLSMENKHEVSDWAQALVERFEELTEDDDCSFKQKSIETGKKLIKNSHVRKLIRIRSKIFFSRSVKNLEKLEKLVEEMEEQKTKHMVDKDSKNELLLCRIEKTKTIKNPLEQANYYKNFVQSDFREGLASNALDSSVGKAVHGLGLKNEFIKNTVDFDAKASLFYREHQRHSLYVHGLEQQIAIGEANGADPTLLSQKKLELGQAKAKLEEARQGVLGLYMHDPNAGFYIGDSFSFWQSKLGFNATENAQAASNPSTATETLLSELKTTTPSSAAATTADATPAPAPQITETANSEILKLIAAIQKNTELIQGLKFFNSNPTVFNSQTASARNTAPQVRSQAQNGGRVPVVRGGAAEATAAVSSGVLN